MEWQKSKSWDGEIYVPPTAPESPEGDQPAGTPAAARPRPSYDDRNLLEPEPRARHQGIHRQVVGFRGTRANGHSDHDTDLLLSNRPQADVTATLADAELAAAEDLDKLALLHIPL